MEEIKISIQSNFEEVDKCIIELEAFFSNLKDINQMQNYILIYALREILNNSVEHGNRLDAQKKVQCKIIKQSKKITIEVKDEGLGFILEKIIENIGENDVEKIRNRGIYSLNKLGFQINVKNNTVFLEYIIKE